MIDSAPLEARPDTALRPELYTWEAPGKPVVVGIPLALIDRLDHEAAENYRSLSSRGSEIGGVLFGSVALGFPTLVTIAAYTPVVCDYGFGPLYRLSESDLQRLDRAIADAGPGLKPVGFFRSHTRKGLCLDPSDRKLLDSRFSQPHCVALLVRPCAAAKTSTAGIFIWENGEMQSTASHLEFPFRASELKGSSQSQAAGRARIVPIASRRELSPLPQENPFLEPAGLPSRLVTTALTHPPRELKAVPVPVTISAGRSRVYMGLSSIAVLAIALLFVLNSGALRYGRTVAPVAASALSLQVERRADEIFLTWDVNSQAVRSASGAVMEIADGQQRQTIRMDRARLQKGSFAYTPSAADIVFKMSVDIGGPSSINESLHVVNAAPAPASAKIPAAVPPRKADKLPAAVDAPVATAKPQENTAPDTSAPDPESSSAQLISRTEPEYPEIAREAGAKGTVKLIATIGPDGNVKSVKPVSGATLLIEPATDAVMHWHFQAASRNGVPIESETEVELNFSGDR